MTSRCRWLFAIALFCLCGWASAANAQVCEHDFCEIGTGLDAGCDTCVADICAVDSFCCDYDWDQACIEQVVTVCGQTTCSAACEHGLCETGGPLDVACNPCAADICAIDPGCCSGAWDATCVAEIETLCPGVTCLQGSDKCVDAVTVPVVNQERITMIGDLTNMTNNGCESSGGSCQSPDVWYDFTTPTDSLGRFINTCGTQFSFGIDTVLSLHSNCPGNVNTELISNDDWKFGPHTNACIGNFPERLLDSGVPLVFIAPGTNLKVRVSHHVDSTDNAFQLYVPEPGSALLGLTGVATLLGLSRWRHSRARRAAERS